MPQQLTRVKTKTRKLPQGIKLDLEGYPYAVDKRTGFTCRVSPCCYCGTTIDEYGGTYCKKCFRDTPYEIELPPELN